MAYPGGKAGSGAYQKIINQIPPHRVYIEPFLGNGAVLRHKRPAQISYGLDMDSDVVNAWIYAPSAGIADKCDVDDAYQPVAIPGCIIEKCDAISFLSSYNWQGDEFVYCDPPYLYDVRAGGRRRIYDHEFGEQEQHAQLLSVLLSLPCNIAVSGYWSRLYAEMLDEWRTIHFPSRTRGGTMATEWLWMNYSVPAALHDYRYLGDNFRQRERFNRIRKNMLAKLDRMDPLERYAILSSIADYGDGRQ